MQAMHEEGRNALALSIRGWNGQPDDSNVVVAAYTTVAATSAGATEDEPPADPGIAPTPPYSGVGLPTYMGAPVWRVLHLGHITVRERHRETEEKK